MGPHCIAQGTVNKELISHAGEQGFAKEMSGSLVPDYCCFIRKITSVIFHLFGDRDALQIETGITQKFSNESN